MGCLTLFALFRGRELSLWRLMRYALVGILLFSPFSLMYDVGLALSFGAVIGIVLMQKWLELLFPSGLPRFVSQYLSPTL